MTQAIAERYEVDMETPWYDLPEDVQDCFLYGTSGDRLYISYRNRFGRRRVYTVSFDGMLASLQRRYENTDSEHTRERIEALMALQPCPACGGARLKPESLGVTVGELNIHQVCDLSIATAA
jgi:excinuclease ABC subunit A